MNIKVRIKKNGRLQVVAQFMLGKKPLKVISEREMSEDRRADLAALFADVATKAERKGVAPRNTANLRGGIA